MQAWQPQRRRLSDQVADRIKKTILDGTFPPLSRLPSERDLAQQYGVTRLTLREALKATEQAGFTETRHGAGTFVVDVFQEGTLEILGALLRAQQSLGPDEIRSLLEFRAVVIRGFAPAIISNHAPHHIERLREIVAAERIAVGDIDELVELDFQFHHVLATASANRIFILLMQSVKPAYQHLSRLVFQAPATHVPIADAHEAIAQAIASGDTDDLSSRLTSFITCGNSIILRCTTPTE